MLLYYYLRSHAIENAERKTLIIMTYVKAIGDYVKDSFRPRMLEIISRTDPDDEFLVESISTTHVNMEIMKKFNKDIHDYIYRRVSDKPLNPQHKADSFHMKMIEYFRTHRDKNSWHSIVKLNNRETLVYARPVISSQDCLICHGKKESAPVAIVKKYGNKGNFGWQVNKIVGVETVSIPMDVTFKHLKSIALSTFLLGLVTLAALFFAIYETFSHLVSRPIKRLSNIFKGIVSGSLPLGKDITVTNNDEIGELTESFNILARHLHDAQERLKRTAKIERQMMETEKLAALGQLSAGIAHEINNPIGGIQLCFNNLMSTEMDEQTRQQHIDVVISGLNRIQTIVKQLLEFSRNSPLSISACSINTIVENVLKITEYTISKKGISLVKDLSSNMPLVRVDSNKMEQVLLNIIMNAVQAMDKGGTLTIRTWSNRGMCNVSISDTGKGIPDNVLSKIFDPFFTTKDVGKGTGLGLTVSKAIVEQHGGRIEVETSHMGTTFTVKIPCGEETI
jgi:signal transduction histidine kinase